MTTLETAARSYSCMNCVQYMQFGGGICTTQTIQTPQCSQDQRYAPSQSKSQPDPARRTLCLRLRNTPPLTILLLLLLDRARTLLIFEREVTRPLVRTSALTPAR